ncbi:NDP-hexose 2,3-dehydratase family protein [Streptomyces roseoverticillatus]|uniref:NDP-hexose 2,3-dehydratase family protein n=1 Tax=Streptomyces roseoverticillatus TaxID=66429 RepID=UPI00099718EF|nr:NDP-hexose 2,3-dehydratase family protein [Streptomyces roseoverticillatus]
MTQSSRPRDRTGGGERGGRPDATALLAVRFGLSAATTGNPRIATGDVPAWLERVRRHGGFAVSRIPFAALDQWSFHPGTGNLGHSSGRFFTVEGLRVSGGDWGAGGFTQPVVNQPESGILGILAREIDGVLHLLMQAKMEPGNTGLVQLGPTVQATRSNYTRAHRGGPTRYLEHFTGPGRGRVLVDVLQSEQGDSFWHKRNRNMVVEVSGDIPVQDGHQWMTLGQVHALMGTAHLVNMDVRTVLSCLPLGGGETPGPDLPGTSGDISFHRALARSLGPGARAVHDELELLSWLTDLRTDSTVSAGLVPLRGLAGWRQDEDAIAEESGTRLKVIAVSVRAGTREVTRWTQPMLEFPGQGVAAFVVKRIDGVLHILMQGKAQPGIRDAVELAPTVQCVSRNWEEVPPRSRPPMLDHVLRAARARVRFDAVLPEEGGRFYHRDNRYLVVEADDDFPAAEPDTMRWATLNQLKTLMRYGTYVNVEARTLIACLQSLWPGDR